MDKNEAFEPMLRIGERLKELAAEMGLELVQCVPLPDFSGNGNHAVQAVFAMPGEINLEPEPELPPECAPDPELDSELEAILDATAKHEEEELQLALERAREAEQQEQLERHIALRQRLARPDKGFLD